MADHRAPAIPARLIDYCDEALRSGRAAVRICPTSGAMDQQWLIFNFVLGKFCLQAEPKRVNPADCDRCRSDSEGFPQRVLE
jgi:hypothetical protein